MSKKAKKLTKAQKKRFQDALRAEPEIRKKAAKELSSHMKRILEYVSQEASSQNFNHWDKRKELNEYICKIEKSLEEQLILILDLTGGDDIVIGRKSQKPERWELIDLEKR